MFSNKARRMKFYKKVFLTKSSMSAQTEHKQPTEVQSLFFIVKVDLTNNKQTHTDSSRHSSKATQTVTAKSDSITFIPIVWRLDLSRMPFFDLAFATRIA
jgi:hypothetical protein